MIWKYHSFWKPPFWGMSKVCLSKVFFSDIFLSGALDKRWCMGDGRNLRWLHMGSGQDVLSLGGFHTSIWLNNQPLAICQSANLPGQVQSFERSGVLQVARIRLDDSDWNLNSLISENIYIANVVGSIWLSPVTRFGIGTSKFLGLPGRRITSLGSRFDAFSSLAKKGRVGMRQYDSRTAWVKWKFLELQKSKAGGWFACCFRATSVLITCLAGCSSALTILHLSHLSIHLIKLQTEITQKRLWKIHFLHQKYTKNHTWLGLVQMRLTSALASCLVRWPTACVWPNVSTFLRSRIQIETWEEFSSNLYGGIVVVLNCCSTEEILWKFHEVLEVFHRVALQVSMPSLSKIMYIQCSDSEMSVSLRVRMWHYLFHAVVGEVFVRQRTY